MQLLRAAIKQHVPFGASEYLDTVRTADSLKSWMHLCSRVCSMRLVLSIALGRFLPLCSRGVS